jgi:hypothetical protein
MKRAHCVMVRACSYPKAHAGAFTLGVALVWMASLPSPAWGQWSGTSPGPIYYNNGSVGIGTASPSSPLHVEGLTTFHRDDWGNSTLILRGQKSTQYLWGEYAIAAYYAGLAFNNTQTGNTLMLLGAGGGTGANIILAPTSGNVGIGTWSPQYLLSVNGQIGAKDVIVTNAGWSDYVFQPGYRLQPLGEVNDYIQANRHLPDIPSESEVKEKGVSVAQMQTKLLAKIEELTLHMIRQDKENRELRERLAKLEAHAPGSGAPTAGR